MATEDSGQVARRAAQQAKNAGRNTGRAANLKAAKVVDDATEVAEEVITKAPRLGLSLQLSPLGKGAISCIIGAGLMMYGNRQLLLAYKEQILIGATKAAELAAEAS